MLLKEIYSLLFEMANLRPQDTGLNYIVYASPMEGGHKPNTARIKVSINPKQPPVRINCTYCFVVVFNRAGASYIHKDTIRVANQIPADERIKIFDWVKKYRKALFEYWDGRIDTKVFILKIRSEPEPDDII